MEDPLIFWMFLDNMRKLLTKSNNSNNNNISKFYIIFVRPLTS